MPGSFLPEFELYVALAVARLKDEAYGAAVRREIESRTGAEKVMVPWLHDPNTGVEMFESADIVAYLHETYAQ